VELPAGSRGRAPGRGAKPPEAKSFLALKCPRKAEILPTSRNSVNSENDQYLLKISRKIIVETC